VTAIVDPIAPASTGTAGSCVTLRGGHAAVDNLQPSDSWTIEATVQDLRVKDGVIAAVTDRDLDCCRALVMRRGRLGLIGWSWRGGQAFWSEVAPASAAGAWAHVAACFTPVGDLLVYVDGKLLRAFAVRGLAAGHYPQRAVVGASAYFVDEEIPRWRGQVRDARFYDHALKQAQVEQHARAALGLPEPAAPAQIAPRPPDPTGCAVPAHAPAWRRHGDRLRCLQCEPPRGCSHDDHQRYWRTVGGDMRIRSDDWTRLECSYCRTAARRGRLTNDPGEHT
jgi:hypothetical protein